MANNSYVIENKYTVEDAKKIIALVVMGY